MPPVDWAIIQSLLLKIVLPSFGVGLGILAAAVFATRSVTARSVAASLAFVGALAIGNFRAELVPFFAVQYAVERSENQESGLHGSVPFQWEFETGWYSLFSVVVIAVLAEAIIDWRLRHKLRRGFAAILAAIVAVLLAVWVTPSDMRTSLPWTVGLLAAVFLLNTLALRHAGQFQYGHCVPLFVAVVWGGSATGVAVLAHSARFADLAMLLSCSIAAVGIMQLIARQRWTSFFSGPATFVPGLILGAALNTYSEIPVASFVLVAVAPAFLTLLRLPRLRNWCESRPVTLAIAFVVPCVIAVGLAMRAEL